LFDRRKTNRRVGLIKHLLSGGFIYLMIVNALPWMEVVLNSFSRIGAAGTVSQT
jgi:hypothetical protein